VVSFSQLPPPTEAMFKNRIRCIRSARDAWSRCGAERHGSFPPVLFVQPITVWDEPALLAFDVRSNRPRWKNVIYNTCAPPHLENYFLAQRGQLS
jgi:hypothetical protein